MGVETREFVGDEVQALLKAVLNGGRDAGVDALGEVRQAVQCTTNVLTLRWSGVKPTCRVGPGDVPASTHYLRLVDLRTDSGDPVPSEDWPRVPGASVMVAKEWRDPSGTSAAGTYERHH